MVAVNAMQASTAARVFIVCRSRARGLGGVDLRKRYTSYWIASHFYVTSPKRRSAIAIKRELDSSSAPMRFNQSHDQAVRLLSNRKFASNNELDSLPIFNYLFSPRRRY